MQRKRDVYAKLAVRSDRKTSEFKKSSTPKAVDVQRVLFSAGDSEETSLHLLQNSRRLTVREMDVLHWLTLGKSGGEIGVILGISVCTVRVHIRNIIRKLDASNIPHAVARAFKMGILDG